MMERHFRLVFSCVGRVHIGPEPGAFATVSPALKHADHAGTAKAAMRLDRVAETKAARSGVAMSARLYEAPQYPQSGAQIASPITL
jgi:hypothetical protein